jgi:5-(carboxyamino)imidazole ribonucleotide synthase
LKRIRPGETIGILGGGQLGRMMAIAAKQMGFRTAVLDPTAGCPAAQVSDIEITASYDDLGAAQELAAASTVVTYEFENVDGAVARYLEDHAYLPQGAELLQITQDRALEKAAVRDAGEAVVPYRVVVTKADLERALSEIGLPAILKTARGGYDGKGQFVLEEDKHVLDAFRMLDGRMVFVLERRISFEKELSVIVTRGTTGEARAFPVAENIHVQNILHQSIVPARIDPSIRERATQTALKVAEALGLIGTLAVEMFLTADGRLLVNELAPRPHNSGHYTIEACETSQFEQHVRAICGWPLGPVHLLKPAVMVNVLGQHVDRVLAAIPRLNNAHLHLYGKAEAKPNRKMGHVTILADTVEAALAEAEALKIWND